MTHARCYCYCHQSHLADIGDAQQRKDLREAQRLIERAARVGPYYALDTDPVEAVTACRTCLDVHAPALSERMP